MQCVAHLRLHDPMTFGCPAPYADITGAPYKRAVVEWMLNVMWSQTCYNKRAHVERSRTSACRNVIMATRRTSRECMENVGSSCRLLREMTLVD